MKKNNFDPFMQIKFENAIKEAKTAESIKETYNSFDSSETLGLEKRISFRTPQIVPGFVVLLTSESIGNNNEVGKLLLKEFVKEITNLMDLPEYVIFVNEAVNIIEENIDILKQIKKYGVKIIVSDKSLKLFDVEINSNFIYKLSSSDIAKKVFFAKKIIEL